MNDREWLSKLKAGDKVIVQHTGLGRSKTLTVVSHLTKNFIVVRLKNYGGDSYDIKFRKESGYGTGDVYRSPYLIEATPEALAQFEEERYRSVFQNKLRHLSWDDVPLDRIKQIRELVEPYIRKEVSK